MMLRLFFVILGLSAFTSCHGAVMDQVWCSFQEWSYWKPGKGQFNIEDIDPFVCTHLLYSLWDVHANGTLRGKNPWLEWDVGFIPKTAALKKQNPDLKVLLTVGGWDQGVKNYSTIISDPAKRAVMVQSSLDFMLDNNFDGINIDMEYPYSRGTPKSDVENYVLLVKEMREAFDPHGFIVTVATAGLRDQVTHSYDVPGLAKYAHYINIMSYDFHQAMDSNYHHIGHNAGLYPSASDTEPWQIVKYVDDSTRAWIEKGAPPSKIIMGIATHAHTYTLKDKSDTKVGALYSGKGLPGPYSNEAGTMGYNEVCEFFEGEGWTVEFDMKSLVPFTHGGKTRDQWITYDNPLSVAIKMEYGKSLGLAGVAVWALDIDDFRGVCGRGKFPVLNAINQAINRTWIRS